MVAVEVANANGRTCDVVISWGWTNSSGKTDRNGRVLFDVNGGTGKIYVDGREVYNGRIEGTVRVLR